MDLDDTQALDLEEYEYDETEEEQEIKKDRKQVGQLKVFRTEDFEEKNFDIYEGENFIGRDQNSDVHLPRKSLSKTHACIEVSEDLHLVYDDNSKNKTRRDKTILKPQVRYELHHGDMLTLADTKCQYFKGKIEQDNDDDETGSETGSESMLPEGSAIHIDKDTSREKDAFAADTDSDTDDEKNPVTITKPVVYSSDEKLSKPDVAEDIDQPKPIVPAFMYDSSEDDDDERASKQDGTKSSSDIKAQMDVSADSGTLAFGLVSPDDVPIIRPTSKKMPEVENTPLTLVYSPDTQDRTPDNPGVLPKGKEEGSSCEPTLIYGSEDSPYQEKSSVKRKGSNQPESTKIDSAELSADEPDMPEKSHVKNIPEPQREIASCAETLPVQETESLKETPIRDVEPTMLYGTGSLKETPLNDMPNVGETPSESNVYLPETQGFSPGNEETSFCEPTQAYLQESPVDTPKESPGEKVLSDVTSIPDSQEEGEKSDSDVKKVLSYDDDSATQAYTWNDSDATDDEDDELRFQATQAYPSHIQQPKKDSETKAENVSAKDDDDLEQGSDVEEQDRSPSASSPPTADMQQTIAYEAAEMDTQAYVTEKDNHKDHPVEIEPTLPYNIMDMETQAYEAETEESASPASDRLNESNTGEELHEKAAVAVGDSIGVTIEPTLPYDLETETQDFDNNEKDDQQASKKNAAADKPVIETTVPYDIETETQAYDGKDIEDSETDDEDNVEKKAGNMADMMETQAYGAEVEAEDKEDSETDDEGNVEKKAGNMADMMETQAYGAEVEAEDKEDSETDDEGNVEKKEAKIADIMETQAYGAKVEAQDSNTAGPSYVDDAFGETQAYGLEDQMTSPATDHIIPDSEDVLSQEIPLNRISQDEDTVNNNAPVKTPTAQHDKQEVEESCNKEQEEEAAEIIVRPKRRGKGRVTQSSTEEEIQQPANKPDGTTIKITEEPSTTAPENVVVKRSTRGKKSKKSIEMEAEIQDTLEDDSEEDQFQIATKPEKGTRERRSTRVKTLKTSKADVTEGEQSTSMAENRVTRGRRSKKSEPDDTEEQQQQSASITEKSLSTRGRRSKKSDVEISVPDDTEEEEQQQSASITEKSLSTRGRRSKKRKVEISVPDDTEEEQQQSASMTAKRPTRGRRSKKSDVEIRTPENREEEQQELVTMTGKRSTRGTRSKKSEVELARVEDVLQDTEEHRVSVQSVPTENKDLLEKKSLRGRRSAKTGQEDEKEEKPPLDESKPESSSEKRVPEKISMKGTRSKKKSEEDRTGGSHSGGDNKGQLGTPSVDLKMNEKSEVMSEVDSEDDQFAVKLKRKGKAKSAVPLQVDQDSPDTDEELPSLDVILSSKKAPKGKGKTKETPAALSSNQEMSSETVEVKPFFHRRGRGRVTQSDESVSAVPGTSGSELTEFKQEELISPQSVATSLSTRKGNKRNKENETQEYAEMDTSASQGNTSSPGESKTRKKEEMLIVADLDESQSSAGSSVGRKTRGKGRGKNAKATEAEDTHPQSASQASDVSESQGSSASSVESRARGKGRRRTAKPSTLDDTQEKEVQETPTKKGRTIKQEDSPTVVHSPSLRERKPHTTPKVMFTGVSDKQAEKIVTSLGGILVDSVYECTHLITDKVRRTVKFLCGLASGQMIVQPQWLTACKKAKHFIEPVPFIVSDKAAEKQYSFSLQESLEKAQKGGPLQGYKLHITKNVKPEPSQMKDIIKSAKGEYLPRMPRTMEDNVLVVSIEEDQDLCKPALACGLPVYSSELLLTGILRQELELDQNRLFCDEDEGNRKRKESDDGETVKSASRKRRKK